MERRGFLAVVGALLAAPLALLAGKPKTTGMAASSMNLTDSLTKTYEGDGITFKAFGLDSDGRRVEVPHRPMSPAEHLSAFVERKKRWEQELLHKHGPGWYYATKQGGIYKWDGVARGVLVEPPLSPLHRRIQTTSRTVER